LGIGLVDTFRAQHPNEVKYSWWSFRAGARERNIGWRLDYFLVSKDLFPKVQSSFILPEIEGSDHCPVGIELA
jgi:exodeoxyribonuclease-3